MADADSLDRSRTILKLPILNHGSCEMFKAGVHGAALGLAAVMGLYNAAAWLRRREPHLAVNAVVYWIAAVWEQAHVAQHLSACRPVETDEATAQFADSDTPELPRKIA